MTSSGASLTLARSCEERVPTWRHAHAAMRGYACGALLTRGRRNGTHSSASSWAATAHARTVLRPETLVELSNCGREHIRRGAQTCTSELRRWPRGGGALSSDRAPLYINNRRGHFFEKLLLWKLVFSFDGRAVARRVEPCWNTLVHEQPIYPASSPATAIKANFGEHDGSGHQAQAFSHLSDGRHAEGISGGRCGGHRRQ